MRRTKIIISTIFLLIPAANVFSQSIKNVKPVVSVTKAEPSATMLNINQVVMGVKADGLLKRDSGEMWGIYYPKGTGGVIYSDGFLWGGFVKERLESELRVGGQYYKAGTVPGCITSQGVALPYENPDGRIWRIRRDWATADLSADAAGFFKIPHDEVTPSHIHSIRSQYEKDWLEWPWQKGAPFYDDNNNGTKDEVEEPGLAYADQVVWFVANDLDSLKTKSFLRGGSSSIGLEEQVTLWAYNRHGSRRYDALQHIIFKQIRLIYKGHEDTPPDARIDSMFVCQFVESDIGDFSDDFSGCDTTLNLGFGYNSSFNDEEFFPFRLAAPAFGYAVLRGPLVKGIDQSEEAWFGFQQKSGYRNQPMTAFWFKPSGSAIGAWDNPLEFYCVMNGYLPWDWELTPFLDLNGKPTKYMVSGDPVTGSGWLDGYYGANMPYGRAPGNRQFIMSSGPFTMVLSDTQEVTIALIGGLGSSHLTSVSVLKHHAKWAHQLSDSNFEIGFADESTPEPVIKNVPSDFYLLPNYPNPFNTETSIGFHLPFEMDVRLTIYDARGRVVRVLHEGGLAAGEHVVQWDGTEDTGKPVASGVYICRLEADRWVQSRKMVLLQ